MLAKTIYWQQLYARYHVRWWALEDETGTFNTIIQYTTIKRLLLANSGRGKKKQK